MPFLTVMVRGTSAVWVTSNTCMWATWPVKSMNPRRRPAGQAATACCACRSLMHFAKEQGAPRVSAAHATGLQPTFSAISPPALHRKARQAEQPSLSLMMKMRWMLTVSLDMVLHDDTKKRGLGQRAWRCRRRWAALEVPDGGVGGTGKRQAAATLRKMRLSFKRNNQSAA